MEIKLGNDELFGFLTSAQTRDKYLSTYTELLNESLTKRQKIDLFKEIQRKYRELKEERAKNPNFVECPRCREHHNQKSHYEGICHNCRLVLLDNFPNHPFTLEMEKHDGFIRK